MSVKYLYQVIGIELTRDEVLPVIYKNFEKSENIISWCDDSDEINYKIKDYICNDNVTIPFEKYLKCGLEIYCLTHDVDTDNEKRYIVGQRFNEYPLDPKSKKDMHIDDRVFSLAEIINCGMSILQVLGEMGLEGEVKLYTIQNKCSCCVF